MPLSTDQLVYTRRQTGDAPDDAVLDAIYDRLGDVDQLILEVLETRYANLVANPASFSVAGEYSQSTGENLKALERKIAAWRAYMVGIGLDPGPPVVGSVLAFLAPDVPTWR